MTIAKLFLLILAAYGLAFTLIDASIFEYPRSIITKIDFFRELLHCYFCTGFWAGAMVSTVFVLTLTSLSLLGSLGFIVLFSFAAATTSYAIQLKLTAWETQQHIYGIGLEDDTD